MRHRLAPVLLCGLMALAACSTDRHQTQAHATPTASPTPSAAPSSAAPVVGTCHHVSDDDPVYQQQDDVHQAEVPCSGSGVDVTEAIYAGTFTGAAAGPTDLPTPGSGAARDAYQVCMRSAASYFGGDFHSTTADLTLVVPTVSAWSDGQRWFRCDLAGRTYPLSPTNPINHAALIRDGLRGTQPAAVRCLKATWGSQTVASLTRAGCNQPHQVEFTGTFVVQDIPWSEYYNDAVTLNVRGCAQVTSRYLGYPNTTTMQRPGLDAFNFAPDQERWQLGDRTVSCFIAPYPQRTYVGSYKGVRTGKPHV